MRGVSVPAIGNIYEVRLFQSLYGQEVLNVFHYRSNLAPGNASDLVTQFGSTTVGGMVPVQSTQVTYTHIVAINLDDAGDFGDFPFTGASGEVGGDCLPSYASWSFVYERVTRLVRNGSKRIAGVPESLQANGVATGAALTLLAATSTALLDTLFGVSGASYTPVILHKQPSLVPDHVGYGVSGVRYAGIGTQNTRKIGRGA